MKKYLAWEINSKIYQEIYELALKNGKRAGDSMQEEFNEILKQKPNKFKLLGATNQDVDMITGNLREQGKKIINMNEIDRRNNANK